MLLEYLDCVVAIPDKQTVFGCWQKITGHYPALRAHKLVPGIRIKGVLADIPFKIPITRDLQLGNAVDVIPTFFEGWIG